MTARRAAGPKLTNDTSTVTKKGPASVNSPVPGCSTSELLALLVVRLPGRRRSAVATRLGGGLNEVLAVHRPHGLARDRRSLHVAGRLDLDRRANDLCRVGHFG